MSGVAIVWDLLKADSDLLAVVDGGNIRSGFMPQGTSLPAIVITQVSGTERLSVTMSESPRLVTERVQVDILAATYPQQKQIRALVRSALPLSKGTVGSYYCDGVLPDFEGPDIYSTDPKIFQQSMDFIVRFSRSI